MALNERTLEQVAQESPEVLVELDKSGMICGADEDGKAFAARLKTFSDNARRMETALAKDGAFEQDGMRFSAKDRIGARLFDGAGKVTSSLYDFSADWVPGFYRNPRCSFLFGGCTYWQYPDFFVYFILRRSFRKRSKWLMYDREELLSHELCHVARAGLNAVLFEESLAYRTGRSGFRRLLGGMFLSPVDSFLFLGSAILVMLASMVRTFWVGALPIWPFWVFLVGTIGWQLLRHARLTAQLNRAARNLAGIVGASRCWQVVFRCTDDEIRHIAGCPQENLRPWLDKQREAKLRWRIIYRRFFGEDQA